MHKIIIILAFLVIGCSGSLNDSGIFWCAEDAQRNQVIKKAEIRKSVNILEINKNIYSKALHSKDTLQADIKSINYKILSTRKKIVKLQSEQGSDMQKLKKLEYDLQEYKTIKRKLEKNQIVKITPSQPILEIREDDMSL